MRVNVLVRQPYDFPNGQKMIIGVYDLDPNVAKRWIKEGTAVAVDDEPAEVPGEIVEPAEEEFGKPLEKMTVKELKEYAEDYGIDISQYKKKADIVSAIYDYEDKKLTASDPA